MWQFCRVRPHASAPVTEKTSMIRRISWVCCIAAIAGCSNAVTNGGGGGGLYKLPDAGKTALDGVSSVSDLGATTGTGDGNDQSCATACPTAANADTTCTKGVCGFSCHTGFLDCDGNATNGCEIDSTTHPSHCGTCDTVCGAVPNGTPSCVASVCAAACDPGWQVCKTDPLVCDTNTDSDASHCGDCNTECPGGPNSAPRCVSGSCTLKCDPGFADCNKIVDDGCEINTTNDANHCGTCGLTCGGTTCINSACECASSSQTATLTPLDIFIMMDQSGSMTDTTGTGATKWDAVTQAVTGFVQDPASAGIGVGIQYFPLPDNGSSGGCPSDCSGAANKYACENGGGLCLGSTCILCLGGGGGGDSCTSGDYQKPEVAISALPGVAPAIMKSMAAHAPTNSTPTQAALQGAIDYAKSFAVANPTHTVVVLLATDGDPTECAVQDPVQIGTTIAAPAAAGNPKILTFVIGVGTSLSALNAIASSGGTGQAFVVDTGGNVLQQFEAALKAIQGKAIGCQYTIPVPANGQAVDPTKVNVQFTLTGGTAQPLKYVDDESKCDPTTGGWHYDNALTPTKILLCAKTCTKVSADAAAKVDILLGCARQ